MVAEVGAAVEVEADELEGSAAVEAAVVVVAELIAEIGRAHV